MGTGKTAHFSASALNFFLFPIVKFRAFRGSKNHPNPPAQKSGGKSCSILTASFAPLRLCARQSSSSLHSSILENPSVVLFLFISDLIIQYLPSSLCAPRLITSSTQNLNQYHLKLYPGWKSYRLWQNYRKIHPPGDCSPAASGRPAKVTRNHEYEIPPKKPSLVQSVRPAGTGSCRHDHDNPQGRI